MGVLFAYLSLRADDGGGETGCVCQGPQVGDKPVRSVHKNLEEFVHLLLPLAVLMEFSKEKEEK